ncbi:MAG: ATP-binding cassette domain-containing protein [Candidatus Zixiibacteriota bacterium]
MCKIKLKKVSKKRKILENKSFKEIKVLHEIDLKIKPGEICTILGPSGCGKTTLLRLLNRLEETSSGSIYLDNQDIKEMDVVQLRRKVGLVFQVPVMMDESVLENLFYGLKIEGKEKRKKEKAMKCLELTSLNESFLTRDSSQLSVGEKQRISIARTLMLNPEVLLLDEPTSALDPTATLNIEKLVLNLNASIGLTTLFVTHDISQALRLGRKCMILIEGKKIEEGNIKELYDNPQNELTRKFFKGELSRE